jgi:hypothetical protein
MPDESAVMDAGLGLNASVDTSVDTAVETPETPVDEGAELEATETTAEDTADQDVEEAGAPAQEKAIKEALRALKETNPQAAKALNEAFFQRKEFLKEFPDGLASVRQLKATVDAIGGPDGLANLQSRSTLLDQIDSEIAEGNPAVLDSIMKDSPDGFKRLVPEIINRLQSLDAKSYGDALRPHFVSTLEAAGLDEVIEGVDQALKAGDGPGIQKIITNLYRWYAGLKQQVQKTSSVDPERQKFEQERTKFSAERESTYRQDIGKQAQSFMAGEMQKALAPFLKGKNLSADARSDLDSGVNAEINKLLLADATYQQNMKGLLKSKNRDVQKITNYINAKLVDTVPKAARAVWQRRYGSVPVKAAPAANGKAVANPLGGKIGGNAVPVKLLKPPATTELDLTKDPQMLLFLTGKGYLKSSGKLVSWEKKR